MYYSGAKEQNAFSHRGLNETKRSEMCAFEQAFNENDR